MIYAALDGIERNLPLPEPADFNLFSADPDKLAGYRRLPGSLAEARKIAAASDFICSHLPASIVNAYCG